MQLPEVFTLKRACLIFDRIELRWRMHRGCQVVEKEMQESLTRKEEEERRRRRPSRRTDYFFSFLFFPSFLHLRFFSFIRHLVVSFFCRWTTHSTNAEYKAPPKQENIYIYGDTALHRCLIRIFFLLFLLCPLLYRSDRVIWGISLIILSNNSHMALLDDDNDRVAVLSIDFNFQANVAK